MTNTDETQTESLEEYLQKIEKGKNDSLIAQIVNIQERYVADRVKLDNGEAIKQRGIEAVKEMSGLGLDRLASESHLIASMFERAREEGLGDADCSSRLGEKYNGRESVCQEALAKIPFLAYATQEIGNKQEQFLEDYLDSWTDKMGVRSSLNPEDEAEIQWKYVNESRISQARGNLAFVKSLSDYKRYYERACRLRDASHKFKRLIGKNKDSPCYPDAAKKGAFYGTWSNGIMAYFRSNPGENEDDPKSMVVPFYDPNDSLTTHYLKLQYSGEKHSEITRECVLKGINKDGILEIEIKNIFKKETKMPAEGNKPLQEKGGVEK